MAKLTKTQLIVLSAALQHDDRAVEPPENVQGRAVQKAIDKLVRAGLLEEVSASGSLPIWRLDDSSGPMALRITRAGLEAIDAADEATAAPPEIRVRPAATREVATAAPEATVSRNRISVEAQKAARKRHRPDGAKTKTSSLRDSRPGSIAEFEPGEVVSAGGPRGVLPPAAAATTDMPERAPADIERTEPEPVAFATREWEPPTSAIMEPALAQAVNAEPTPAETESAEPAPPTSAPPESEPSASSIIDPVLAEAVSAEPMRAERWESSARASITMLDPFGFLTVISRLMRGAAALNVAWTNWTKRYLTISAEILGPTMTKPSGTEKGAKTPDATES
jgi:hypothetical protein